MASIRGEIHVNEIPLLKEFLEKEGYILHEPIEDAYEIIRAYKNGKYVTFGIHRSIGSQLVILPQCLPE